MKFLRKNKLIRNFIFNNFSKSWARGKYNRIKNFLDQDDLLLDLGAGKCALSWKLKQEGYNTTPVDVQNLSFCSEIEPIIYDGKKLPFADNSFDKVLLLTVLHHIPQPKIVIKEALRAADELIIIEDVYSNPLQKYLTFFADSLFNFEFIGHPHSNKTEKEWQKLFDDLGLKIKEKRKDKVLIFFDQVTYHLSK
ncbi:MAG: class I SAM-dependent methyltransferase [Bacillota bacterium]